MRLSVNLFLFLGRGARRDDEEISHEELKAEFGV